MIGKLDENTPFIFAYIDWCKKEKNIDTLAATENHALVMEFWKLYSELGGDADFWEIAVARGDRLA